MLAARAGWPGLGPSYERPCEYGRGHHGRRMQAIIVGLACEGICQKELSGQPNVGTVVYSRSCDAQSSRGAKGYERLAQRLFVGHVTAKEIHAGTSVSLCEHLNFNDLGNGEAAVAGGTIRFERL
ncbi:MAG: hypothetical protein ACM3ZU_03860 [Bacteroidota bacterium]